MDKKFFYSMIKSFSDTNVLMLWKDTAYEYITCMLIMYFYRKKPNTFSLNIQCRIVWNFLNFLNIFIKCLLISKPLRQFFKNFSGIKSLFTPISNFYNLNIICHFILQTHINSFFIIIIYKHRSMFQTVKKGQQKLAFFDTIKTEVKIC